MPNILIIEDQLLLCETLRLALERPGYAIRCAESAEQGMLYVLNWDVDVVVVDYMLPGMNGVDLINWIGTRREQRNSRSGEQEDIKDIVGPLTPALSPRVGRGGGFRKPRIILLSAMMNEELKVRAMAAGADGCLAKPFNLIALRMMVAGE